MIKQEISPDKVPTTIKPPEGGEIWLDDGAGSSAKGHGVGAKGHGTDV